MKGAEDEKVLETAQDQERALISFDNDFNNPSSHHHGVIHITRPDKYGKVVDAILEILETFSESDLKNSVVQVSPSNY